MVLHTGIHCFRETDWKRIDIAACRQQRNKDTDTGKHNAFTCMRMSCICPNALIWKGIENKVLQPGSLLKREKKKKKQEENPSTPQNQQHGTIHMHADLHSCFANFIANAGSASASRLEGRTSSFKTQPCQILHSDRKILKSELNYLNYNWTISVISLCTPREQLIQISAW